jgi:hypothetical protein
MAQIWTAVTSPLISLALVKNARVVAVAEGMAAAAAAEEAEGEVAVVSVATAVPDGTESFPLYLTMHRRTSRRILLRLLECLSH